MRINREVRYEMVMSNEEINAFTEVCSAEHYEYWININEEEGWTVLIIGEETLDEVKYELDAYLCNIDNAFDAEMDISTEEWNRYAIVKNLYKDIVVTTIEEEW